MREHLEMIFPVTSNWLSVGFWQDLDGLAACVTDPALFVDLVHSHVKIAGCPDYLGDLARVELARNRLHLQVEDFPDRVVSYQVNPSLEVVPVSWQPLLPLLEEREAEPRPGMQMLLFWRHPVTGKARQAPARPGDLLALKLIVEGLDPLTVAASTGQPVGMIDSAIEQAADRGLLLMPSSSLRRDGQGFPVTAEIPNKFLEAEVFTLQWHITHRCDLNCRHCYDRSHRDDVELERGLGILDQLRVFCLDHHVRGQVSFSGGNPFLHPDFFQLYQGGSDRNLGAAILGNPVSEEQLDRVLKIAEPSFYQVSLEGLEEHNDYVRGSGNFVRILDFLDLLRRKGIYSMVMLTLTRNNFDQVLPLGEVLGDRADLFTFNRLSMVGEGSNLESPGADEYRAFLRDYLRARQSNPVLKLKDSLINIEYLDQGKPLFGGCTGFGCGAAFNFVSLLPDGQVHACRKFPSPIGDLNYQTLSEVYDSSAAQGYRNGCQECEPCSIRAVCGGCLAVAYGFGLNPLQKKDPACFIQDRV